MEKSIHELKSNLPFFPGHYYSPNHNLSDLPEKVVIDYHADLPGIDLNEKAQLNTLSRLKELYRENIYSDSKQEGKRYYFDNDYFGYSDGIFLNGVIRDVKPKRIIEVGSGFSSSLMLDTNDEFMGGAIILKFIEPYPEERLLKLINENENCTIIKDFVQNVGSEIWNELQENDILFIDSSHVSKYHSDVNFLFFEVFPNLKPGVIIHIHDVFFPFEYPLEWLKQGRSWSEAYLLRAFLQYNNAFEIILFPSFLEGKHTDWFKANMPLCLKVHKKIVVDGKEVDINTTGQSIYIRKKGPVSQSIS